jgi:hypothetical protein
MFVQNIVAVLIAVASLTNCFDGLSEQLGEYPYPTCEDCRDPELMVAPGIGFDLTHSYG